VFGAFFLKAATNQIAFIASSQKPSFIYSFNFKGNVSKMAASVPDWDYPYELGTLLSSSISECEQVTVRGNSL